MGGETFALSAPAVTFQDIPEAPPEYRRPVPLEEGRLDRGLIVPTENRR